MLGIPGEIVKEIRIRSRSVTAKNLADANICPLSEEIMAIPHAEREAMLLVYIALWTRVKFSFSTLQRSYPQCIAIHLEPTKIFQRTTLPLSYVARQVETNYQDQSRNAYDKSSLFLKALHALSNDLIWQKVTIVYFYDGSSIEQNNLYSLVSAYRVQ